MSNVFEDIRAKLSVVDVISGYIAVKGSGSSSKACCPFHNEKSASLMLSDSKGVWHCFGCGLGGDIFKFVMLYENVEKKDALRILAAKAGVTLEPLKPRTVEEKKIIEERVSTFELGLKYLGWTAKLYHQILLKILQDRDNPITQYCLKRGYDLATIQKFQLGYAPKGDFVINQATKFNMNLEVLAESSILKKTEQGEFKDKFTDRLMVPILDRQARAVGFTARILPYDTNPNRPKYLNSSQSQWFNKSELWYGWSLNSTTIRQLKKAIIVEGNMDVIKASQSGLEYSLASQGTSFTTNQLKILKQITPEVHLAFDNDTAGKTSAKKFFLEATSLGLVIQKLLIPENYKDLDEALSDGYKDFKITPYLDYWLEVNRTSLGSDDSELQKKIIVETLELLRVLDPVGQEQYLNKLSKFSGISVRTLEMQIAGLPPLQVVDNEPFVLQDRTQNITKNRLVLIAFQKLACQNKISTEQISNLFLLLQVLIKDLAETGNYQNWLVENQAELDLVKENLNRVEGGENSLTIVQQFLSNNLSQFLMDNNLKRVFSEVIVYRV